jgi:hypothetical protein
MDGHTGGDIIRAAVEATDTDLVLTVELASLRPPAW